MNIKFLRSPVGRFNLAYGQGEEVNLEDRAAKELIEAGYAVEIPETKPIETAVSKEVIETPEKKKGKK